MANRLTRIYTRTGDGGTTSLGNGERVAKTALRVQAMGDIDEVNCLLGAILAEKPEKTYADLLLDIQHLLFEAGGELSLPGESIITEDFISRLEQEIDRLNADLGELKEFILPGGSRSSSLCHIARAVCRRAERNLLAVAGQEPINDCTLKVLNRLSDLLFVLARNLARADGCPEPMWDRHRWRPG